MLLTLLAFSLGCTPPGADEDRYGHPRALLANCTRTDDYGDQVVYDADGYIQERRGQTYQTTLDARGRPSKIELLDDEETHLERFSYVDTSWKLSTRYVEWFRPYAGGSGHGMDDSGTNTLNYVWGEDHYEYTIAESDAGSGCVTHVDLAEGLRDGESEYRCGVVHSRRTLSVWEDDRLKTFIDGYVAEDDHSLWTYSYDRDGRLSQEEVSDAGCCGFTRTERTTTYTWSCP